MQLERPPSQRAPHPPRLTPWQLASRSPTQGGAAAICLFMLLLLPPSQLTGITATWAHRPPCPAPTSCWVFRADWVQLGPSGAEARVQGRGLAAAAYFEQESLSWEVLTGLGTAMRQGFRHMAALSPSAWDCLSFGSGSSASQTPRVGCWCTFGPHPRGQPSTSPGLRKEPPQG